MKIQTTVILTIGIVLMVILSVTAFNTFSFAVRTNTTHSQSTATTTGANTTKTVSSQITTKNPVLTGGTDPCNTISDGTKKFYWDHVYDVNNGKPWGRNPGRLDTKNECITVTGNVSSSIGGGTSHDPEGDGDLHFTLQLDPKYEQYSNGYDPKTCLHKGQPCSTIIVEVICHTTPTKVFDKSGKWGDYCGEVDRTRIPLAGIMPPQGERLSVSGRWVQDYSDPRWPTPGAHDPWMEIHPAIDVHKIP